LALPTKYRLIKDKDFDRVFKEGKTVKSSFLFIKFLNSSSLKVGIAVSSKVYKKANERNRVKRIISEELKKILKNLMSLEMIIVVNKKGPEDSLISDLNLLLVNMNAVS